MSSEAVQRLLTQVEADSRLREECVQALAAEQPVGSFLAVASRHGFDCTAEQRAAALEASSRGGELEAAELDGVVGGAGISLGGFALKVFRPDTAGPHIGSIGPGTGVFQQEEEEIQT